jgi:hypothetical protein
VKANEQNLLVFVNDNDASRPSKDRVHESLLGLVLDNTLEPDENRSGPRWPSGGASQGGGEHCSERT